MLNIWLYIEITSVATKNIGEITLLYMLLKISKIH